jgi:hypothetical protein
MKYRTGNPVGTDGSTDPRDMYDNAGNLDQFLTSEQPTFPDRLNKTRPTLKGFEIEHQSALDAIIMVSAGDFFTGTMVTARNQTVLWSTANGGNGHEYRWAGALNKTVPANSTPLTTGGIYPDGQWIDAGVTQLRRDLAPVAGIKHLRKIPNMIQTALSFHTGLGIGRGNYLWLPEADQSQHLRRGPNGGILWAAAALDLYDGTPATLKILVEWAGSGAGCFELEHQAEYGLENFGATYFDPINLVGESSTPAIKAAKKAKADIRLTTDGVWKITEGVDIYSNMSWKGDDAYSPSFYLDFATPQIRMFRSPDPVHKNVHLSGFTLYRIGNNAEHGVLVDALDGFKLHVKVVGDGTAKGGAVGISAFYPENRPSKNVDVRVLVEKGGNFGVQFGNVDTGSVELISLSTHRESLGIEPYALGKIDISVITSSQLAWPAHGMENGYPLIYSAQGNPVIPGLLNGRYYFVIVVNANTIKLAQSKEEALRGTSIVLGAVTGVQRFYKCGIARNIQVKELSSTIKNVASAGSLTGGIIITATSGGYHENIRIDGAKSEQSNFTSGNHNIGIYGAHNTTISNCDLFGTTNSGSGILVTTGELVEIQDATGDISPEITLYLLPDCVVDGNNIRGFDSHGIEVHSGRCLVKNNVVRTRIAGATGISLTPDAEQSGSVAEFNRADVPNGIAFSFKQGRGNVDANSLNQFERINRRTQRTYFYKEVNLVTSAGVVATLTGLKTGTTVAKNYSGEIRILAAYSGPK